MWALKTPAATLPARHKELMAKSSYSGDCMLRKLDLSFRYLFLCNGLWTSPYSPNVKRLARSSILHARAGMLEPSFIYLSELSGCTTDRCREPGEARSSR